jgi:hypothetical protein
MDLVRSESADDDQMFRYQPLDNPSSSIRLIEVDPELSTEGGLQIHLFDSALSEEYTCLSYVWGQENDNGGPFPVLVNGKTFHTRSNLYRFLHVARTKYPKRRFWIDAICIDQTNMPERNQQVQQMGKIYSEAKEVIGWLGDNELAAGFIPIMDDRAHHVFRHIPDDIRRHFWSIVALIDDITCYLLSSMGWIWVAPVNSDKLSAFDVVITGYWERAWITQEIALAKHVYMLVSEKEFDLDILKHAKMPKYRSAFPSELVQTYRATIGDHHCQKQHLLTLLQNYQTKKCEKRRDRVFSLLSICLEGPSLKADYTLSEELFFSTVLRTSRLTPCLCAARVASGSIDGHAISKGDIQAPYLFKVVVQAADVYMHPTTQRKLRPCCRKFSKTAFKERGGDQLFCLYNVCSGMDWHLSLVSQEPDKHHVYGITCKGYYKYARSVSLGDNGKLVDIRSSPQGGSYVISFTLEGFMELVGDSFQDPYWTPKLCKVARQPKRDSAVEYLDIGP